MVEHAALGELEGRPHARPFDPGEPAVIRLALEPGDTVDPHSHPDRSIVLVLLSGEIELTVGETEYHVDPLDVIRFDGRQTVSPTAIEESQALIVLAKRDPSTAGK